MVSLNLIFPYSLKNLNLDLIIDMIIFICYYYLILEISHSDLYHILWETPLYNFIGAWAKFVIMYMFGV
ncbi:MAG: hypothetical protein RJB24_494 [Candidatus Parcubacteria bacterium]|jgi:hypothetical protein